MINNLKITEKKWKIKFNNLCRSKFLVLGYIFICICIMCIRCEPGPRAFCWNCFGLSLCFSFMLNYFNSFLVLFSISVRIQQTAKLFHEPLIDLRCNFSSTIISTKCSWRCSYAQSCKYWFNENERKKIIKTYNNALNYYQINIMIFKWSGHCAKLKQKYILLCEAVC